MPENGALSDGAQLFCIFIIIYLGTLSMVMFVNFIPSLVVLNLPTWLYLSMLSAMLAGSILGLAFSVVFLVEPQKTFDLNYAAGSGNDPILASIGVFFSFGFAFLVLLCAGIIAASQGKPSLTSILYRMLPVSTHHWKWRVIGPVLFFISHGYVIN